MRRITSLDLLVMFFLMQLRRMLATFAARVHYPPVVNQVVHQDSQGFLCRAAFKLAGPQHALVHGDFPSHVCDLAAPGVEFNEIPVQPVHILPTGTPVPPSTCELARSALCP